VKGHCFAIGLVLGALVAPLSLVQAQVVIPPDTVASAPRDTAPAAASPAPSPPAAPVDSVLAAACARGEGHADGLLIVEFRPALDAATRAAVAKAVGGKLRGMADGAEDLEYLEVAASANLNAVADRVILQNGVESVGAAQCPPVSAPSAPAPTPPAAPPAGTGGPG
jgi:hypothetical protein